MTWETFTFEDDISGHHHGDCLALLLDDFLTVVIGYAKNGRIVASEDGSRVDCDSVRIYSVLPKQIEPRFIEDEEEDE